MQKQSIDVNMEVVIGAVLEGKVSGITKFGAFVTLENGVTGLVHISEVANTYVSDIKEHLKEGQTVKVKVIDIKDGKINLSIKKAAPPPPRPQRDTTEDRQPKNQWTQSAPKEQTFEDKLKLFMQDSDSRISGLKNLQGKNRTPRRGRQR